MATTAHIVSKIVFELDVGSEAKARPVQDRVSVFCRDRLALTLNGCLSEFASGDTVYSFAQVELDLGTLSEQTLEGQLAERIREALKDVLLRRIPVPRTTHGPRVTAASDIRRVDPLDAELVVLAEFLHSGRFDGSASGDPDRMTLALLANKRTDLLQLLRTAGSKQIVRRRLAHQLSQPVVERVVRLLAGSHADFVIEYAADIRGAHHRKPIVPESRANFGKAIWEFILTFLLLDRGSYFNTKSFVGSTLRQMAARYRVTYHALLSQLIESADDLRRSLSARDGLSVVLLDLRDDDHHDAGSMDFGFVSKVPPLQGNAMVGMSLSQRRLQSLASFLERGVLSWLGVPGAEQNVAAVIEALIEDAPDALCELIRRCGARESVRKRLAHQFPDALIEKLAHLLQPDDGSAIVGYVGEVRRMHARKPLARQDHASFGRAIWIFALSHLLLDRGSYFNNRSFIKDLLQQMASHFGIDYHDLLAGLVAQAAALRLPFTKQDSLPALLVSLNDEVLAGLTEAPVACDKLDLLAYWFSVGVLPSWSKARGLATIEQLVRDLAHRSPSHLRDLLAGFDRHPALPARLSQLSDASLHALLALLAPLQNEAIQDCIELFQLAHRAQPLPGVDVVALRALLWELTFSYLLSGTKVFKGAAIAHHLRRGVARRYRMDAGTALAFVEAGVKKRQETSALPADLVDALTDTAESHPAAAQAAEQAPISDSDALERFLLFGIWPPMHADSGHDPRAADAALSRWLAQLSDATLERVLRRSGMRQQVAARIVLRLSAEFFARAIRTLAGADARFVLEWVAALRAASHRLAHLPGFTADGVIAYQRQVGEYVLAYLAQFSAGGGDHALSMERMMRNVLLALSTRHAISYRALLHTLIAGTPEASALAAPYRSLRDKLAQPPRRDAMPDAEPAPDDENALALYFLRYGTIPDWSRRGRRGALQRFLADGVLTGRLDLFLPALKTIGDRPEVILRLLQTLTQAQLLHLIEALVPTYAGFIHTYLLAGAELAQDTGLSGPQRRRAHALHWESVLAFLLNPHAPTFALTRFLSDVSNRVAQRLGLTPEAYRLGLQRIAANKEIAEQRYAPLAQMLGAHSMAVSPSSDAAETMAQENVPAAEMGHAQPAETLSAEYLIDDGSIKADADPIKLLQYLLQFGVMPTARTTVDRTGLMNAIARKLTSHAEDMRHVALWAASNDLIRMRLVRLLTSDLLQRMVFLLLPNDADAVAACMDALPRAVEKLVPGHQAYTAVADGILRTMHLQRDRSFDLALYVSAALRQLADQHGVDILSLADVLHAEISRPPRHVDVLLALENVVRELELETLQFEPTARNKPDTKKPSPHLAPQGSKQGPKQEAELEQLPTAESFYVANAGGVLLWPFVQRYFQMLDLMQGNVFSGFAQQCRAAHLLQYLVSGTVEASEHELLLNKIICGIKTALPLEVGGPLSDAEKQASEQLLHSVTQNWSKLKNTSIEGLRETFLMREGRLVRKEDNWTLTVSGTSFDVLLQSLPWGFSTIRLPWMEGVLWVHWK